MKNIKKFSAILLLAAVMALTVVPVTVFAAEANVIAHDTHIDTTGDGYCDIEGCDEKLPCTNHTDVDGDGFCDITGCDEKLPCTEHKDENRDGVCDSEGCDKKVVCEDHVDADKDRKCDTIGCEAEVSVEGLVDIGSEIWSKNIIEALKILGIGILGIFLVTGIIILVVYALNKFTNLEKKAPESEE